MDGSRLVGIVTLSDLERAVTTGQEGAVVGDICTRNVVTAYADETLDEALSHFGALDVGRMPVVERGHAAHVVGMLGRGDIVHAISGSIEKYHQVTHHMERVKMEAALRTDLTELYISKTDGACNKALKEIPIPEDSVIVSIQRGRQIVIPRGITRILPGDRVIALVGKGSLEQLRSALRECKIDDGEHAAPNVQADGHPPADEDSSSNPVQTGDPDA